MKKCICCDNPTAAGLCDRCQKEWDEVSAANIAHDQEQDRLADERFQFLADTLKACYPTTIPESWLK